jgi:hypothetical protein
VRRCPSLGNDVQLAWLEVTGWRDTAPATAVELLERDHHESSSDVAVDVFDVDVERFDVAALVGAVSAVVAMPPVMPVTATMLSHPATRRARRAGWGRFRRRVVWDIGQLLVGQSISGSSRRVSASLEMIKKRTRTGCAGLGQRSCAHQAPR